MDTFVFPFINFSIITPAQPASPEDMTVSKAGNKGITRMLVPDLAIWIEATLDVNRIKEAH